MVCHGRLGRKEAVDIAAFSSDLNDPRSLRKRFNIAYIQDRILLKSSLDEQSLY